MLQLKEKQVVFLVYDLLLSVLYTFYIYARNLDEYFIKVIPN